MAVHRWLGQFPATCNGIDADLVLAHALADAADAINRTQFTPGNSVDHQMKADGSPVSPTDLAVERELLRLVRRDRPNESFLGEEVGAQGHGRRRWVVDGIDGTSSFVAGGSMWSTLVALVEDGTPVVGVKSSPAQGRRWWAGRGRGAWSCAYTSSVAERLAVRAPVPDGRLTACLDLARRDHPERGRIDRLAKRVDAVPMTTHPAFMVAGGDIDFAIQVDGGAWDYAAAMAVVWEAGGGCLDLEGNEVARPQPPVVYAGSRSAEVVAALVSSQSATDP